jgi:AraC-like DNA-binding protein
MDIRAQQAREHHRESAGHNEQAARHREQRDRLVRQLRSDDPQRWTYTALAAAVGCSPELIAHIVKHESG